MTPTYHDGLYENARRGYRPCPRSFHIPAPDSFAVSVARSIPAFICAAVFCAAVVALCVMVSG
jgi:hypothetical protein